MPAWAGLLALHIPGCSGAVPIRCRGRGSAEPRAGVIPWRWEGRAPASVMAAECDWTQNTWGEEYLLQTQAVLLGFRAFLCFLNLQILTAGFQTGLIQTGFVGKMMWNGIIMIACLEREILCDCLYWSVLSRTQPHRRLWLGCPGNVVLSLTSHICGLFLGRYHCK